MVWIEISGSTGNINMHGVTTDAVVWIEMYYKVSGSALYMSPLMQWCGLKYFKQNFKHFLIMVTTDAVVWIEMLVYL